MTHSYLLDTPREGVTVLDLAAVPTLVVRVTDYPMAEMGTLFDATFSNIGEAMARLDVRPVGPAFSFHTRMPTDTADFEVGLPLDRHPDEDVSIAGVQFVASKLPPGRVATTSYLGAYDGLGDAWGRFMDDVAAAGMTPATPFWEVYVSQPTPDMDPATLRTDLYTTLAQ